jgi:hypothetical protein
MGRRVDGHGDVRSDTAFLDISLCLWLGERLSYLAKHARKVPVPFTDNNPHLTAEQRDMAWRAVLATHADILIEYGDLPNVGSDKIVEVVRNAQDTLRFVADWLPFLWD